MFPEAKYEEFSLATRPADAIILFSDGIPDAQNAAGEMFGDELLMKVISGNQHRSASEIASTVLDKVTRFRDDDDRFDDETVDVLKVVDGPAPSGE